MLTDLTKSDTPYVNTVMSAQRRYVRENPQQVETFSRASSMDWPRWQSRQ
jgi:hypothetical protein